MASNWLYNMYDDHYEYVGSLPSHTHVELWRRGTTPAGASAYCVRIEQYGNSFWLEVSTLSKPHRSCWIAATAKKHAERWIQEHVNTRDLS